MLSSFLHATDPGLLTVAIISIAIVIARIIDVSLSTFRTVAVIQGRRGLAWILGFFEVLVWVLVVSEVLATVKDHAWYAIPYSVGFASGNWLGIWIEAYFALGNQVVRIFSKDGAVMAAALRDDGFGVTEFDGRGKDGPVAMLFVAGERKRVADIVRIARACDPKCYYTIGDVRTASTAVDTQSK
ncbi:MAG: DUF2179 domain-containing protein [Phycisphaerales bacterium]|nr:DUF2179 domain-containing protein [Phycisphaerales bacterium]